MTYPLEATKERCGQECGGWCCKNKLIVLMTKDEATRLKKLNHKAMITQGMNTEKWAMAIIPQCIFLTDENLCGIHEQRPDACRQWPYTASRGCLLWPKEVG